MIKFTNAEDNKQFISIAIKDGANTTAILNRLIGRFDVTPYAVDDDEIILEISANGCVYSLNDLREYIKPIAQADITHFAVDMDEPNQRYKG